jgi:hypothetical protein
MLGIPERIPKANAAHEIGHAIVGTVLGIDLVKVAIVHRVRVDGNLHCLGHARFRRGTWIRRTKKHNLYLIAMTMAGMAAEELFLGGHDDGVAGNEGSDLFEATKTAMAMERAYGMGAKLASFGDLNRYPEVGAVSIRCCFLGSTASCKSSSNAQRAFSFYIGRHVGSWQMNLPPGGSCRSLRCAMHRILLMSGLEVGRRNPSIVTLYELARALGVGHFVLVAPEHADRYPAQSFAR